MNGPRCSSCGRPLPREPAGTGLPSPCPSCGRDAAADTETLADSPPETLGASAPGAAATSAAPADATILRSGVDARAQSSPANSRLHGAAPEDGVPFGRYRLLDRLGAGGMGVVWKAYDPALDRTVALKQILRETLGGEEERARFVREARVAAQVRHPNVVAVYDVGEEDGAPFLTMEYVEGRTLAAALLESRDARRSGAPLDRDALRRDVERLAQTAEGVGHAHAQGIVHRDLKPANVLLDRAGRARVMDFGLAKQVAADGSDVHADRARGLTLSGQVLGTPSYMSPEQAAGELARVGVRSDVWSLGVMLYETLSGRTPFAGDTPWAVIAAIVQGEPAPLEQRGGRLPRDLAAVCAKALEREPSARYAHAGEFAADLKRWLEGRPVEARPPSAWRRAGRWAKRRRGRVAASCAALLIALAAAGFAGYARSAAEGADRALLAQAEEAIRGMEDRILRVEVDPETVAEVMRQPLAILDGLVERRPQWPGARAWRGRLHHLLGDADAAQADLERACALDPGDAAAAWLRGLHRIALYGRLRGGLPIASFSVAGTTFEERHAETPRERELREGAIADLERAARLDRGSVGAEDLAVARALAALWSGAPEGLRRAEREAAAAGRPDGWRARGQALYFLGSFAAARDEFGKTLAFWPRDAVTLQDRACALLALGNAEQAAGGDSRAIWRAALDDLLLAERIGGARAQLANLLGHAWSGLGDAEGRIAGNPTECYRKAVDSYTAALEQAAGEAAVLANRGHAWRSLGVELAVRGEDPSAAWEASLRDLTAALEADAGDADALQGRARTRLCIAEREAGRGVDPRPNLGTALADLDRALALAPRQPTLLYARGDAFRALGEALGARGADPAEAYARGEADFDALLAARPDYPDGRRLRGALLAQRARGRLARGEDARADQERALADFDAAVERDRGDPMAWYCRGSLRLDLALAGSKRGEDPVAGYRGAVADLERAVALKPDHGPSRFTRGNAHQYLARAAAARGGDPKEEYARAEEDYRACLERRFPMARLSLGMVLAATGRPEEALKEYQTARTELPGHAAWLDARIAEVRRALETWPADLERGNRAYAARDFAAAGEAFEAGFAGQARAFAALPEAARTERLRAPMTRVFLQVARYHAACVEAALSAQADAGAAARHRDRAFAHLAEAVALGLTGREQLERDEPLAPLRADPRFREILERLE